MGDCPLPLGHRRLTCHPAVLGISISWQIQKKKHRTSKWKSLMQLVAVFQFFFGVAVWRYWGIEVATMYEHRSNGGKPIGNDWFAMLGFSQFHRKRSGLNHPSMGIYKDKHTPSPELLAWNMLVLQKWYEARWYDGEFNWIHTTINQWYQQQI